MSLRYVIVLEKAESNWCAYSPDVPGCVATGSTREEARGRMREALQFHLEGLREDGDPLPESLSDDAAVEVLDLEEPRSQAHVSLARHG